jgi:hypothetical protein
MTVRTKEQLSHVLKMQLCYNKNRDIRPYSEIAKEFLMRLVKSVGHRRGPDCRVLPICLQVTVDRRRRCEADVPGPRGVRDRRFRAELCDDPGGRETRPGAVDVRRLIIGRQGWDWLCGRRRQRVAV